MLAVVQGPIRVYFYYHIRCFPLAGSSLCELTVYLDYISTQINNFPVTQLLIERFFIIAKPFICRRRHHHKYSLAICRYRLSLPLLLDYHAEWCSNY